MVRGRLEMKKIENDSNRQVTFSKRRAGLFKKAFQLAVLCDSEVALLIFSNTGKLFEFASKSVKETVERYKKHMNMKCPEEGMDEAAALRNRIKSLETSKQRLMGADLDWCSIDELQEQEDQLENALANVKTTMSKVVLEQMVQSKEKGRSLAQENAKLKEQLELLEVQTLQATADKGELESNKGRSEDGDVETELFLGLPESRK